MPTSPLKRRPAVRTNYDLLAAHYDENPYRQKDTDPLLRQFLAERGLDAAQLVALDMGCGTGNQLAANWQAWPQAKWFGLDLFAGMLKQAVTKAGTAVWIQGDNALPPFRAGVFDYISNQFSFHHVRDKVGMVRGVYRLLKGNGRFTMTNVVPRQMPNWIVYQFFPEAYAIDLRDFLPLEALVGLLMQTGFVNVRVETEHWTQPHDLHDFATAVQQRHHYSQITTLSETDYQVGWQRIQTALAKAPAALDSEICLMTLTANKIVKRET
ncbi:MAG: methyltransferase domain-containing protein [Ardenticatenaceae bacterium]|nr:methyltransferase domain-containing protein [Anaerolineales bacterium]MCB8923944.1 methyltransferase domain-containing protein [Ardenticatenaceae bacterium]MCB9005462.1 methyltransferase domain-containing protein [Ardenticatenaceae bacterium]